MGDTSKQDMAISIGVMRLNLQAKCHRTLLTGLPNVGLKERVRGKVMRDWNG
jgi:hypothetical protein